MGKTALELVQIMRNVTGRVDASDPLFTNEIMIQRLTDFIVQLSTSDIRIFKNYTWYEFDIDRDTPNPMFVDLQSLMLSTIGPLALIEFPVGSPPPGN